MQKSLAAWAVFAASLPASAAPVGLDGSIGAEWAGVTAVSVGYDSSAATGNFGAPGTTSNQTAYDIYTRRDGQYLYTAIRTTGGGDASGVMFANLYFSLRYGTGPYGSSGSSIGFEVTNDRAFKPGVGGYYNDTAADLIQWVSSEGAVDVIEMAIDLSVFTDNALGVAGFGLPSGETAVGVRLNLSQSFGYSVAGGSAYGEEARLGFVDLPAAASVPEPASLALAGLALFGAAAVRRRA